MAGLAASGGVLLGFGAWFLIPPGAEIVVEVPEGKKAIVEERLPEKPLRLLFVGDIMLDRGVENVVWKYGGGDFMFPFEKGLEYLYSFDGVIGNLEGPVSDKGELAGSEYSFRMDPETVSALAEANLVAVNLANNHMWDYGREAFSDTMVRLQEGGVGYFGAGENETGAYGYFVLEEGGTKVAFLGFTEFLESAGAEEKKGGVAFWDAEKAGEAIREADMSADVVVVSMHAGEEYVPEPTSAQVEFARAAADAGADLVVGHHPHVIETEEVYKGKHIFYSLGNFVFDQYFSEETMTPGLLEVEIRDREVYSAVLRSGKISGRFQFLPPGK